MTDRPATEEVKEETDVEANSSPTENKDITFDNISNKAIGISITGFSIIGCIAAFMVWCIYQIFQKTINWFRKSNKAKDAASSSSGAKGSNAINNRANDNEVYNKSMDNTQPLEDQYTAITKSIQDSFKKHELYNSKLTAYYNNVKGQEGTPGEVIDAKVLLPQYD